MLVADYRVSNNEAMNIVSDQVTAIEISKVRRLIFFILSRWAELSIASIDLMTILLNHEKVMAMKDSAVRTISTLVKNLKS